MPPFNRERPAPVAPAGVDGLAFGEEGAMLHLLLAVTMAVSSPVPSASNQREISFTSKDGSTLAGTLSWPAGSDSASPAFVLVGGSGMQDRDETIGPNKPFAELALALNSAGFTVLRYDKRGVGESTSATPLSIATRQDYIDDVLGAVAALKKDPHVDASALYFLGHSEGGELALGAVLEGAPVRGIVMLSPLPMPYADILLEQMRRKHATAGEMWEANTMIAMPFLQSYAKIDPRVEIATVPVPVLLLHGSKDFQVTTSDLLAFIAAAHGAHRSLQYGELDGDNHLFQVLPAGTDSTGAEYREPGPLDPRVIAAIIAWLAETQ
jgi:uncharacterized protein